MSEDQDLLALHVAPQYYGSVETAVTVGKVAGDVHVTVVARELLAAHALGPEDVKAAREVYVEIGLWDEALRKLEDSSLIGLLGDPGSSRWITGVNLAATLELSPALLELDPDDKTKPLPADKATCYLFDLATAGDLATQALGVRLREHSRTLKTIGSRLVILATRNLWRSCGLSGYQDWVQCSSPRPLEVFRSHLRAMQDQELADVWAGSPQTIAALAGVSSADAVWLATLVDASARQGRLDPDDAENQVFQAYRDWPDSIAQLLAETADEEEAYARALAVAVAVLEDTNAGQVFAAADVLARTVGVTRSPGAGLVGPGAAAMLTSVNAVLSTDDRVFFPRIGYGSALLDQMWRDRHLFRAQLREWFAAAPRKQAVGADPLWATGITRLAVRHHDPDLVIGVAESWAGGATSALAVRALTSAAVSDEAGPTVRRRLYYWATHADQANRHELTADVCGGEMGRRYPRIALTRLRHLAANGSEAVRKKVVTAVVALAGIPSSQLEAAQEIKDWLYSASASQQVTGRHAFLTLVRTDDEQAFPGLRALLSNAKGREVLSDCWWSVLRNPASRDGARVEFVNWLDAAIPGRLPRNWVLDCLSRTCRSALDAGDIGLFLQSWATSQASDSPAEASHTEIIDELSRRASRPGLPQVRLALGAMPGAGASSAMQSQGGVR